MNLFSEIYSCYYQILKSLLQSGAPFSLEELQMKVAVSGYEESLLFILPKLVSGQWNLFKKKDTLFISKLSEKFYVPLSTLQKSYIKALLSDARIGLFFDEEALHGLHTLLSDTEALWQPEDFYYFDRFADHDDYTDAEYRRHFRTLIEAIRTRRFVDISYESKENHRIHHHYLPCRIEYSIKNDKFRLLAIEESKSGRLRAEILNLARMKTVTLVGKPLPILPDINCLIRDSYYKEPVRLRIHNTRNALERAMLQFANYEKTRQKSITTPMNA